MGEKYNTVRHRNRRTTAEKRLTERSLRSPKQQLAVLDERLGKDIGAKRERERLLALLNKSR
jgi:hypothetical protein